MLNVLDLFSGIGGFSLGLERTGGFKTVAFCEIEPFCQKVLKKHWPNVPIYEDVRTLTAERLKADGIAVDVICGGFPCQDISNANAAWGEVLGLEGERSGLWFEFLRLIDEIRPAIVVVENVTALLNRGLAVVLGGLASIGYDAEWERVFAGAIGAPHERDRLVLVAYPSGKRRQRLVKSLNLGEAGPWRLRGPQDLLAIANAPFEPGNSWPAPLLRRVDDGVPNRMDRLHGVGNAVVPQLIEIFGNAILASIHDNSSTAEIPDA